MAQQSGAIRQPVVVVLGHVDSGKTSLLDKIRGTAVQAREAGGITQHIGASFFPAETLREICGPLLKSIGGGEIKVPGLLVIDTPGHEVFTNLRLRGGSAADISILVVDVQKGLERQTYESLEILKQRKVPFVVALNKIYTIAGWKRGTTDFVTKSIKEQQKSVVSIRRKTLHCCGSALERRVRFRGTVSCKGLYQRDRDCARKRKDRGRDSGANSGYSRFDSSLPQKEALYFARFSCSWDCA